MEDSDWLMDAVGDMEDEFMDVESDAPEVVEVIDAVF